MDKAKLEAYDDDALTALLFGVTTDCLAICGDPECPFRELPNDSLSALFDALLALPRYDKLALLALPDCCTGRREVTLEHLRRAEKRRPALVDITHLIRTRRSDNRR